jgi:hypothetical protein
VKIEAEASLRCWPVNLSLGGLAFQIPALPASDWIQAIGGGYHRIVPGLVQERRDTDEGTLTDLVLNGRVDAAECTEAARDAIEAVSGMHWWAAARLTQYLVGHWATLGGVLLLKGVNLSAAPLGAVLTATYRLLQENCKDEAERQRLDIALEQVPPGVSAVRVYDQAAAAANFMALANAPGG